MIVNAVELSAPGPPRALRRGVGQSSLDQRVLVSIVMRISDRLFRTNLVNQLSADPEGLPQESNLEWIRGIKSLMGKER